MDRQEERDRRRARIKGKKLNGGGGSWTQDKRGRIRIDLYEEENMSDYITLGRFSVGDWKADVEEVGSGDSDESAVTSEEEENWNEWLNDQEFLENYDCEEYECEEIDF